MYQVYVYGISIYSSEDLNDCFAFLEGIVKGYEVSIVFEGVEEEE